MYYGGGRRQVEICLWVSYTIYNSDMRQRLDLINFTETTKRGTRVVDCMQIARLDL